MTDRPVRHLRIVDDLPVTQAETPETFYSVVGSLLAGDRELPVDLIRHVRALLEVHASDDREISDEGAFSLWVALSAAAEQSRWWRQRWREVADLCDAGAGRSQ